MAAPASWLGAASSPPVSVADWTHDDLAEHIDGIRRLYLDLTGLPPTPEEVTAFAQDTDSKAYEKLVDQLLYSPRYGERWARHWLDVARYADTKDLVLLYGRDAIRPYAYTYRDYVVRALNEDLPYDQFVRDQLQIPAALFNRSR